MEQAGQTRFDTECFCGHDEEDHGSLGDCEVRGCRCDEFEPVNE